MGNQSEQGSGHEGKGIRKTYLQQLPHYTARRRCSCHLHKPQAQAEARLINSKSKHQP
jgi:hypothetical protein